MIAGTRGRALVIGVMQVAVLVLVALVGPQSAGATRTDVYDRFSACPTGDPLLNDPASEFVICVSATIRGGSFGLGGTRFPVSEPIGLQFAALPPSPESPAELRVIPRSTTLEAAPASFTVPAGVLPSPPPTAAAPAPPASGLQASPRKPRRGKHPKGKRRHGKKQRQARKRQARKRHARRTAARIVAPPVAAPAPVPASPEPVQVTVRLEAAGDLADVSLGAVFGEPGPAYRLPLRIHLEGPGLGPDCSIGSAAAPIVVAPESTRLPTGFGAQPDPNGFLVDFLEMKGAGLRDGSLTVPGASGCGPRDPGSGEFALDRTIDSLLGLPSASGLNEAVFEGVDLSMVGAGFDGTPPDGGAELAAAFAAAR